MKRALLLSLFACSILFFAGCQSHKEGALEDTPTICPICHKPFYGMDNGYGSKHYFEELDKASAAERAGRANSAGRVLSVVGSRNQFWHFNANPAN